MIADNWKQTLLTLIDAEQLPAAYGGTMVDDSGDPMCGQLVRKKHIFAADIGSTANFLSLPVQQATHARVTLLVTGKLQRAAGLANYGRRLAEIGVNRRQLLPPFIAMRRLSSRTGSAGFQFDFKLYTSTVPTSRRKSLRLRNKKMSLFISWITNNHALF